MSKLPIQSQHLQLVWPYTGFACVLTFLTAVINVFSEGRDTALVAQKRYPFADW